MDESKTAANDATETEAYDLWRAANDADRRLLAGADIPRRDPNAGKPRKRHDIWRAANEADRRIFAARTL